MVKATGLDDVELNEFHVVSATGSTIAASYQGKSLGLKDENNVLEEDLEHERRSEDLEFEEYPEGGWEAWGVVFGSWCAWAAAFGITNTMGYLQAWLSLHQLKDKTESDISWIFSIFLFLLFFGGVQVGPVFDRYGLRYLIIPGSIGMVGSFVILSFCKEYYQFILGFSVFCGISCTLVFTPSITVVGHWFYKKRGLATSISATGGACGGIFFPLVLIKTMPRWGFGWSIRLMALLMGVLCILSITFMKTRLPLKREGQKATVDFRAFKNTRFTLTTLGVFMIEWALFVPITYITSYALSQGLNTTFSYQLISILNAASVFGRGIPGHLADKFGRFNVMIITSFFCTIACLAIWLPAKSHLAPIIVFALAFGFWSGSGISLTPVCISQVCRIEDYGKYYGTCYCIVSFGTLTGTPIAGAILHSQNGDYSGLIWFSAIAYLVGGIFFASARVMSTGWKVKAIY